MLCAVVATACGASSSVVQRRPPDLIYAFNKGNNTVSVIDPVDQQVKVVETLPFDAYGLYPSNQYGLGSGYLMLPEKNKVVIMRDSDLKPAATVNMPGANGIWNKILPNGKEGVIVGRSTDQIVWVNMDPASREFGVVLRRVTMPGKLGFCDVSLDPSGRYAYIPDLYASKLQIIDLQSGKTVYLGNSPVKQSFMGTVSWNGKIWAVETSAGNGAVEYFSLANPIRPKLIRVLTQADGIGLGPHTDDFSPNDQYDFVIDRKSSQVSVVSTSNFSVVATINLPEGGKPRVGAFSYHGNILYVSLEGRNEVAAINTHTFKVIKLIKVGPDPVSVAPTLYAWTRG